MKFIIVFLLLTCLCFGQFPGFPKFPNFIKVGEEDTVSYNNISANRAILSAWIDSLNDRTTGDDNLLQVIITGSSVLGANVAAYTSAESQPPGSWSALLGALLQDSMNYQSSDLTFYDRDDAGITWTGAWVDTFGQWAGAYAGNPKYKCSSGEPDTVSIVVDSCEFFAIIYEASNEGDTLYATVNGALPSDTGITGLDTINTYYFRAVGNDFITLKHQFYSGFIYDSTYTIQFITGSSGTKHAKIWGFMKWTFPSIEFITTAKSGQADNIAASLMTENVLDYNPDLVIFQLHSVNEATLDTANLRANTIIMIDSIKSNNIPCLWIIPEDRLTEAGAAVSLYSAAVERDLMQDSSCAYIDLYNYTTTSSGLIDSSDFYRDSVHPNEAGFNIIRNFCLSNIDNQFELETDTLFTRITSNIPDSTKKIMDRLISDLKSYRVWNELDRLWVMAAYDAATAILNWISNTDNLTLVNSPTFTQYEGYTGNGSSSIIQTGFVPNTDGVNFTLNDASYGSYSRTSNTLNTYDIGSNTVMLSFYITGAASRYYINSADYTDISIVNSQGFYLVNRIASDSTQLFKNGALIGGENSASGVLHAYQTYLLGRGNNGSALNYSTRQQAMAFYGGSLTNTQQYYFNIAVERYLDSFGKGVQ